MNGTRRMAVRRIGFKLIVAFAASLVLVLPGACAVQTDPVVDTETSVPGKPDSTGPAANDPDKADSNFEEVAVGSLPSWAHNTDEKTGLPHNDGQIDANRRAVISSERFYREREAREDLLKRAERVVRNYLDDQIAKGAGSAIEIDPELIRERLLVPGHEHEQIYRIHAPEYADAIGREYLERYEMWAELEFNTEFHQWAAAEYENHLVQSRVLQASLVVVSGIAMLGIAFGFLRANHRTRGVYAGRLQMVSLLALLVVMAAAVAIARTFQWL